MAIVDSTHLAALALALLGTSSCGPGPAAPPTTPASGAPLAAVAPAAAVNPSPPAAEPKLNLQAILDRERPPLPLLPVLDPSGRWRAKIEARMPPSVELDGDLVRVQVDVGTKGPLRCEIHDAQIDPGATVASLLRAVQGSVALEEVFAYRVGSVQDVPVLSVSAGYVTRGDKKLAGELKVAISPRSEYSVFCLQDEPGYRASFARSVEGFLDSLETDAAPRPAQYSSVWQHQVGEQVTGYSWDRIFAEADGTMSTFSFDVFLAQLASHEVSVRDKVAALVHDRSGVVQGNFVELVGTTKLHEVELKRGEKGTYTYAGEVGGKKVEGSFAPKAPITAQYESLMQLRRRQGAAEPFAFTQQEYRPEVAVDRTQRADYAVDPAGNALTVTLGGGRSMSVGLKDGLWRTSRVTVGPNLLVSKVISQRSSLGSVPGVTFGMRASSAEASSPRALAEQREGFETRVFADTDHTPAQAPPAALLTKVRYPAPLGQNVAYASPLRRGVKRPAIIWIAGGFDFGIGKSAWEAAPRQNDQSARALRPSGLVLMLPALRGSNENPGKNECFYGEVDDVLAAADDLAKRDDVDPARIYLGGHSTGATLALLVAAATERFAAVFAFGPVADVRQYGAAGAGGCLPEDADEREVLLRAPRRFISSVVTPTFVFEGGASGNANVFDDLRQHASDRVHFSVVPGADHFSVLAPGTEVIARAILAGQVDDEHLVIDAGAGGKK